MIKNEIWKKPSFWGNCMQGIIILLFVIILFSYWNGIMKWSIYEKMVILLLLAIVIGIHALVHLGLEYVYDWNPLEGKWI